MSSASDSNPLTPLRQQIDQIDQELISLLKKRMDIVHQVGHIKAKQNTGSFLRPGREATMVRSIINSLKDVYPASAVYRIWRSIIAASLHCEKPLHIAVSQENQNPTLTYWLAREYFSGVVPITLLDNDQEVIQFVKKDPSHIGILNATSPWWANTESLDNAIAVFAALPFVKTNHDLAFNALAISQAIPESTGDDISVFALHSPDIISLNETQNLCQKAGIVVNNQLQHHQNILLFIEGFADNQNHSLSQKLQNACKSAGHQVTFLGCYAGPITLK